jgi:hypothetical protein
MELQEAPGSFALEVTGATMRTRELCIERNFATKPIQNKYNHDYSIHAKKKKKKKKKQILPKTKKKDREREPTDLGLGLGDGGGGTTIEKFLFRWSNNFKAPPSSPRYRSYTPDPELSTQTAATESETTTRKYIHACQRLVSTA